MEQAALTDAYRCFQTGSCPAQSAAEVAAVIMLGLRGQEGGGGRVGAAVERSCCSVTLVEKVASSLTSQSLPPPLASHSVEVLRVLFHDMDLMSHLVHQFQAEEQIISHLAAKCASTCVLYHLLTSAAVSAVWEQKCVQVFHSSSPGNELDACLWSLTEVIRRLLRGGHQEILGKLLPSFDSSLNALCSEFLPEERKEDVPSSRRWGTTFCLLLDLLEALTASRLTCRAAVCQRITHIRSPALLRTISRSSLYFVKKRALLLLKRAVLQKAGEDWALGEAACSGLGDEHLSSDMSTLAQSVLTAVAASWLQSVEVGPASGFGGIRHGRQDEGQKADCVMLRAVSLLLLKSMELHILRAGGAAGVDGATEVHGCLQSLWGFLRRSSVQLTEAAHPCCWVSLLFGDQDDDMMEAAKALLSIFLHHRRCSGSDHFSALQAACASGCNPHCHFLLLLQSISFDHSILLDFLISAETCFLEYFVRYLKYLRGDRQGFMAACGSIGAAGGHLSTQRPLPASCPGAVLALTCNGGAAPVGLSPRVQPTDVVSPLGVSCLAAGLRLVEYASSDESEPEDMEVSPDEPRTSVCEKSACHSTGPLSAPRSTVERRPGGSSAPALQREQTSCPNMVPLSGQVTCDTSARAARCLSELREVVTRLQAKELFPYNPSSLLKLLAQVEDCSHLARVNK